MRVGNSLICFGSLKAGQKKSAIELYYFKILNFTLVSLLGGRRHFGAITSYFKRNKKIYRNTFTMPRHRDDVITRNASSILSQKLKGPIVAIAGIHYDNATSIQIKKIVQNSKALCRKLLSQVKK